MKRFKTIEEMKAMSLGELEDYEDLLYDEWQKSKKIKVYRQLDEQRD